jgi:hypothetical protein
LTGPGPIPALTPLFSKKKEEIIMNRIRVFCFGFVFFLLSIPPAWALKAYDTFDSGTLNPSLWLYTEQGSAMRDVDGGRVELSAAALSGDLDRNSAQIAVAAAGDYREVAAEVTLSEASRTADTVDLSANLKLSLYNDGSSSDGRQGEVYGYIRVLPDEILCGISRITNPGATAFEQLWQEGFPTGSNTGKTITIGIKWTGTLAFFSIDGDFGRRAVLSTLYAPETAVVSLGGSHFFSLEAEAFNTEAGTSGSVAARFDNVEVNLSPAELADLGSIQINDYRPIASGDSKILHFWEGEREGAELEVEEGVEEVYFGSPIPFSGYEVIPQYQDEEGYEALVLDAEGQKYLGFYEEMEGEVETCSFEEPILLYPATITHGAPYTVTGAETCTMGEESESVEVTWTLTAEGFEDVGTPLGMFSDCLKLGIEILFEFSAESRGASYRVVYLAPAVGQVMEYEAETEEGESMYLYSETVAYANAGGSYDTSLTIPSGGILVDGDASDWAGIAPVYRDYTVIDAPEAAEGDLEALYLAHDYQYLYGHATFAEGGMPEGGSCYLTFRRELKDNTGGLAVGVGDPNVHPFVSIHLTAPLLEDWQRVGEWGSEFPWETGGSAQTVHRTSSGLEFRAPLAPLANIAGKYLSINTYATANSDSTHTGFRAAYSEAPQLLYFPHVDNDATWETEIGLINQSDTETAAGALVFYADHENHPAFIDGEVLAMLPVELGPNGRYSFHCWDLALGPMVIDSTGYMVFTCSMAPDQIAGYEKFYTHSGKTRVAVPAAEETNQGDIYISHIDSSENWWTGIALVNTDTVTKELTLEFDNMTSREVSLAAGEHRAFTIAELFDGTPQPGIKSAVITGGSGVVGLELFGSPGSRKANYLSGILLKDDLSTRLYYPHVDSGGAWWTGIVAFDPLAANEELVIRTYAEDGSALGSITQPLSSGQHKFIGDVSGLGFPSGTAWFSIESANGITGFELFGTKDANRLAGYTGVGISGKTGCFAKIEDNGWTGVAFVNTAEEAAEVTLTAYDDAGTALNTAVFSLSSHEKRVDLAENLFASAINGATYIAYTANQDIVGFQLNCSDLMLDALPGL